MFEKIDRDLIQLLRDFDRVIGSFHAFRRMWAALVASRIPCGIQQTALERHQCETLTELLSTAEQIRAKLGLKWCTLLSDEVEPNGLYLGSQDGGPVTAIEFIDGVAHIAGVAAGTTSDLINAKWHIDGPYRSSVLR